MNRAAADASLVQTLARLLGVPEADLERFLSQRWRAGDAQACGDRLEALRCEFARRASAAAKARREHARGPVQDTTRQVVDELLRVHPRWTKDRAFQELAAQRRVAWGTVRNAYYRVTGP